MKIIFFRAKTWQEVSGRLSEGGTRKLSENWVYGEELGRNRGDEGGFIERESWANISRAERPREWSLWRDGVN